MAGIVEPIVVNQIADEFLLITAPWKQQNMYINELLSKQHETYKEADASSENAHLLAIEMLETISFAIPHYQKDIAQERDIFSQIDVNNLQVKYNELKEIENLFENWTRDTYPKIVEQFMESAARLKTDTEEQLRMRLDSGKQGDILDPLISALEADRQRVSSLVSLPMKPLIRALEVNRQEWLSSLQSLARVLQADCKEKCEVISREILDVYLEEFNSITSDMFEEIKTSLDVEFAALSHDKAQNAPNESSTTSPFVSARYYDDNYYGDNLWFNAFKKMAPPSAAAIAIGSVIGLKAIIGGGWAATVVIGATSLTGVGLVIISVGAAAVATSRFLKRINSHREIQNDLVSYVKQFRDETIPNFSKFHKDGVENTESLLESVLEEMRTKQARGFSAISEATNISEEQKEQKVAGLDATSKQLQKLSGTIKECLRKRGN